MKLAGQCTGGLSCNGGCCRHIIMDYGKVIDETFCEHYNTEDGKCKIYDKREEMGFGGCVKFPDINNAIKGLPTGCGFYLVDEE